LACQWWLFACAGPLLSKLMDQQGLLILKMIGLSAFCVGCCVKIQDVIYKKKKLQRNQGYMGPWPRFFFLIDAAITNI
jgi:hypothetical protein